MPNSVISYFFRVWKDAILSPLEDVNLTHASDRDIRTFAQHPVLDANKRDHSTVPIISSRA